MSKTKIIDPKILYLILGYGKKEKDGFKLIENEVLTCLK